MGAGQDGGGQEDDQTGPGENMVQPGGLGARRTQDQGRGQGGERG